MKRFRKIKFWATIIGSILVVVFVIRYFPEFNSCKQYFNKYVEPFEISGVVHRKFEDKFYHSEKTVEFTNGRLMLFNGLDDLWKVISIGDSVYKPKGSLSYQIFQADTFFAIDAGCRY
jgi:hypothetical protein